MRKLPPSDAEVSTKLDFHRHERVRVNQIDSLKTYLKNNPLLKQFAHLLMFPRNDYRPRWWVRNFVNPFFHKRHSHSIIRRKVRLDLLPNNDFSIGKASVIENNATINNIVGSVEIGENSLIGLSSTVIGPVKIGDNVLLAQGIVISGLNHGFKDVSINIREQKVGTKPILISDNVWVGANCVITAGVKIGKHCVVGAGSVVTKDIPDYSVASGNPAKVIRKYNFELEQWVKTT